MGACYPIHTVGHSTRGILGFVTLLTGAGVDLVGAVCTVPRFQANPQHSANVVPGTMASSGSAIATSGHSAEARFTHPQRRRMAAAA